MQQSATQIKDPGQEPQFHAWQSVLTFCRIWNRRRVDSNGQTDVPSGRGMMSYAERCPYGPDILLLRKGST